ncbi:MAG: hypothetical protein GQ583_11845 [Methyloprofundus sp.]|nr:hypothetical protein [Methyloprofundus sp.]
MNVQRLPIRFNIATLFLGIALNVHAEIVVQNPTIVNVTPTSFSVIWETDGITRPRIEIFRDSAGLFNISNQLEVRTNVVQGGDPSLTLEYTQEQFIANAQANYYSLGQSMIQVMGASPNTTYYIKVYVETESDAGTWPVASGVFAEVNTESANSFLAESNQLLVSFNHDNPSGWLVTASHNDTHYAVAARVGDGGNSQQAYLNLSQLFAANGENWQPAGNQVLTLDVWSGLGTHFSQDINMNFTDRFSVSTLSTHLSSIALDNHIIMTDPVGLHYSTGEAIALQWEDQANSVNAVIDLYYDTDESDADGVQIAAGIEEDADGLNDQYQWDTSAVSDGIYYSYAQMDAGAGLITSYAPATIAIDRAGTDSDTDLLADLWEQLYFGSIVGDGTQDSDADGSRNSQEFLEKTNPTVADFKLTLKPGLNMLSFPIQPELAQVNNLLALLGARVNTIKYIDSAANLVFTAPGNNFALQSGRGYLIDMAEGAELLINGTLPLSNAYSLQAGSNLIGFSQLPQGYSAFQLLQAIGDDTVVASIQRFNFVTGRYDTAIYDLAANVSGQDFPIKRGEAYMISMKQAVNGFVIQ